MPYAVADGQSVSRSVSAPTRPVGGRGRDRRSTSANTLARRAGKQKTARARPRTSRRGRLGEGGGGRRTTGVSARIVLAPRRTDNGRTCPVDGATVPRYIYQTQRCPNVQTQARVPRCQSKAAGLDVLASRAGLSKHACRYLACCAPSVSEAIRLAPRWTSQTSHPRCTELHFRGALDMT